MTSFQEDHPGGPDILLGVSGQDATEDFEDVFHTKKVHVSFSLTLLPSFSFSLSLSVCACLFLSFLFSRSRLPHFLTPLVLSLSQAVNMLKDMYVGYVDPSQYNQPYDPSIFPRMDHPEGGISSFIDHTSTCLNFIQHARENVTSTSLSAPLPREMTSLMESLSRNLFPGRLTGRMKQLVRDIRDYQCRLQLLSPSPSSTGDDITSLVAGRDIAIDRLQYLLPSWSIHWKKQGIEETEMCLLSSKLKRRMERERNTINLVMSKVEGYMSELEKLRAEESEHNTEEEEEKEREEEEYGSGAELEEDKTNLNPHGVWREIESEISTWSSWTSFSMAKQCCLTDERIRHLHRVLEELSHATRSFLSVKGDQGKGEEVERKDQPKRYGVRVEHAYRSLLTRLKEEYDVLRSLSDPVEQKKRFPFSRLLSLFRSVKTALRQRLMMSRHVVCVAEDVEYVKLWSKEAVKSLRARLSTCLVEGLQDQLRTRRNLTDLKSSLANKEHEMEEVELLGMESEETVNDLSELKLKVSQAKQAAHTLLTASRRREMEILREVEKLAPELLLEASWSGAATIDGVDERGVKVVLKCLPTLRRRLQSNGLDLANVTLESLPTSLLVTDGRHIMYRSVWEGEDVILKQYVVKDDKDYARMVREVHTLGHLCHPYITEVKCVFKDKNFLYVVMPFYGGGSLLDLRADGSELPGLKEVRMYMRQAVLALAHVHERHIVHCDIKPDNILLTTTSPPHVVLTDFDVSKSSLDRAMTAAVTLATTPGGMTLQYAAPELLHNPPSSATSSSDIYSLGLTFFDLLFPNHPLRPHNNNHFNGKKFLESWGEYRNSVPSTVFEDGAVSSNLVQLLGAMLMPDPDSRPTANQTLILPFFSDWEKQQTARLESLEEKEVERKGDLYSCCICLADDVYEVDGVVCPSGNQSHFLCRECFNLKVQHDSRTSDDNGLSHRGGSVYCPGYSEKNSPCHASCKRPPLPYTDQTIASSTDDEVFHRYMKGKKALLEAELAVENEKVVRERVERELQEMKRLSKREREVRTHSSHIRESILTVRCPHPNCGQAFVDFSGCFALSCSRCRKYFCGWCLSTAANNDACHTHVRQCASKLSNDLFFGSVEEFEESNNRRRRVALRAFLSSLCHDLSREVVEAVRKNLYELGVREW